jgi:predicted GTPase
VLFRSTRHFVISAVKGDGCRDLTFAIMELIEQLREEQQSDENEDSPE